MIQEAAAAVRGRPLNFCRTGSGVGGGVGGGGGVAAAPLQFSVTLKIQLQLSFFFVRRCSSSFLSERKKEKIFSS